MKRRTFYLIVAILTFGVGMFAWLINPLRWINSQPTEQLPPPIETPCVEGAFTVEDQPEAPARLVIVKAICNESDWKAQLILENTGDKIIFGYEIANLDTYQYKRDGESSQGVNSLSFRPGESKSLNFGGGFHNGFSYGKPVGPIRKNLFWIKRIQYADGTEWRQANQH
jgi:hypothetical protein